MMRLIDAESLKELFPDNGEGSWTYNATVKAYIDAQPIIELEPCGDTISRQAAIEDVGDGVYTGSKIRRWLKSLPSVQPERKTGHWIEMSSANHTYKCSVCGRLLVNITDGKNKVAKNYPYCHCGADMRGEAE